MAVQLIDHVKKETVLLRSEHYKAGRFLQVTDDLKLCVEGRRNDSSNVVSFSEFTGISEDSVDGSCGDCLVSIQFEHRGNNYVVCPLRRRLTTNTTLQLRVKKKKLEETLDRKAEKVNRKCYIYWFKVQCSGNRTLVYESLAYKDFYISIEGENVLLRKNTLGIPEEGNFQIDISPKHRFTAAFRETTEERLETVDGEMRCMAVTKEDDQFRNSGEYVMGKTGAHITDLHVTEIRHCEQHMEKCAVKKSTPNDTFEVVPPVRAKQSSDTGNMSSESSEMSCAASDMSSSEELPYIDSESVCAGAEPSSVTHDKAPSEEETSFSIKAMSAGSTPSTEDHSSGVGELPASGCDLSYGQTTQEQVVTEISSTSEVDIRIDDQDLVRTIHTQTQTSIANVMIEEFGKDGNSSSEINKYSGKRSVIKEKRRNKRFALSRLFSCLSSRTAD
ncbi:uncharacterized protein LOC124110424 [Haliotis rufescens]|uniref:uncharacterized protein LOC124110424 n=1 Tax=Haliotis rufescens TaxID=6454 RepID=UPI00201EAE61|nr:uncharacterized protein LOC124110424 [Haliotis rufescens]